MKRTDNYILQAQGAMDYFLRYDQEAIIRKLKLKADENYLYTRMLSTPYRICRHTGRLQRQEGTVWVDANSHAEVMTLLDLVCDSREDRYLTGRWESMATFGLKFHQNLLEERVDPLAEAIQENPAAFAAACRSFGGGPIQGGDLGYCVDFFDAMGIGILFWEGDEEFSPQVRFLWDANALMYLKYETMHFAVGMLRKRIMDEMKKRAE